MRTRPLRLPLWLLSLSLLTSILSCVTVKDAVTVTPAGRISAGGLFSHTLANDTGTLSFKELVDFLEAQQARQCVPVDTMDVCADDQSTGTPLALPARGAAICMSSLDWQAMFLELEEACRELGNRCSTSTQETLAEARERLNIP